MDSHRTRPGIELDYVADTHGTPYIGIAWEHEFDGKAEGSVRGYRMDDADLGGSTGIISLGVDFSPSANSALKLDAGLSGCFGPREGVAGQFRMQYAF